MKTSFALAAFTAMLASASQRSNLKLHDVARQLVADVIRRQASRLRA